MSEEGKKVFCTQCGSENLSEAKFCSSCGAKLEKTEETSGQEGLFTGGQEQPVYEKVEGETVDEGTYSFQQEIPIQYEAEEQSSGTASSQPVQSQYYSSASSQTEAGNGNIGLAVGSMVCGILSIICCCFGFFSLVLSIAAIVLGIISINGKYDGRGMAIAGIITGGIGALVFVGTLVIGGITGLFSDVMDEIMYY